MVARSAAGHLDADRALDAGGQHVDAVADRRHPDVGQARHLAPMRSSSSTSLSGVMPGAPLVARLELDGGLEHLQRRRVGGGFGAAGLAEHALHLGHGLDQAVGLLQQLGRLAAADRPGSAVGMYSRSPSSSGGMNSPPSGVSGQVLASSSSAATTSVASGSAAPRPAAAGRRAISQRLSGLRCSRGCGRGSVAHQHRHQRHRQPGGGRHGVGLGVGQRREQPALPAPPA
jgi:hypothetical protein